MKPSFKSIGLVCCTIIISACSNWTTPEPTTTPMATLTLAATPELTATLSPEKYLARGQVYADMRAFGQAIVNYGKAIQLKPDYADAYF